MKMSGTQQVWAVVEHGKPLQKIEKSIPDLKGTEILIRVTHCGVCHSDLHFHEGHYEMGGGKKYYLKDRGGTLPRALGHEIVGNVDKLGPDAAVIPLGSSRIVYPWTGCQSCERCKDGDDNLCLNQSNCGVQTDGGYAQYIKVPHEKYLVDYGNLDPMVACTFACSGLTCLSSIQKIMPMKPEQPILLIGAGGLGLAAISILRALGHKNIVSADIAADKRQAALDAGASAVADTRTEDPIATVAKAAGGPIYGVLDFVNNKQTAELAFGSLGKGGKMVPVGIAGGEINLSLVMLLFRAHTIAGNITGTPQHLRDVTQLARDGKLAPVPVTSVPWDQANEALEKLRQGKVTGRQILIH
jgi:alcohol dehydrogenase, propanol-preferring